MKIVLDESVSCALVEVLLRDGHEIVAVANSAASGNAGEEAFALACDGESVLITRDYHVYQSTERSFRKNRKNRRHNLYQTREPDIRRGDFVGREIPLDLAPF